jgi:hypothetical protein
MKKPSIVVKPEHIGILPGECLTVWLYSGDTALQVELRVKEDGKREIFSHVDQIKLQDFEEWYT